MAFPVAGEHCSTVLHRAHCVAVAGEHRSIVAVAGEHWRPQMTDCCGRHLHRTTHLSYFPHTFLLIYFHTYPPKSRKLEKQEGRYYLPFHYLQGHHFIDIPTALPSSPTSRTPSYLSTFIPLSTYFLCLGEQSINDLDAQK